MRNTAGRLILLGGGCAVLGVGVGLLLTANLATGLSFWVANLIVSLAFLALAALRAVVPGIGTVVQVVVVGGVASLLLDRLAGALAILGIGITTYLGSRMGAGPAEAAGLAWDPPVPFRWSYSAVQGGGALAGWLLGATVGPGTLLVILVLGALVDLTGRLLRLEVRQGTTPGTAPVS